MATITMNEIIHAAVRRDLARAESALRSFPDGDRSRAEALKRAWDPDNVFRLNQNIKP